MKDVTISKTVLLMLSLVCVVCIVGCDDWMPGSGTKEKDFSVSSMTAKDHVLAATRYREAGFPLDAMEELEKALKLAPDSREVYVQLSRLKIAGGYGSDAIEVLESALNHFENDAEILMMSVKAHISEGKDLLAERIIRAEGLAEIPEGRELLENINARRQRVIQAESTRFMAEVNEANRLKSQARFAGAGEKFEKAESLYRQDFSALDEDIPSRAQLLYSAAECYLKARMTSEALLALKNATRVEPHNTEIRKLLAEVYAMRGRPELSVQQMEEILVSYPDSVEYRGALASYLHLAGKYHDAVHHLRAILETHPENPRVYYNLALALRESSDTMGAFEACRNAIKYAPVGSRTAVEAEKLLNILTR